MSGASLIGGDAARDTGTDTDTDDAAEGTLGNSGGGGISARAGRRGWMGVIPNATRTEWARWWWWWCGADADAGAWCAWGGEGARELDALPAPVTRAVYVDSDALALRNFDELFALPHAFAAVPDAWAAHGVGRERVEKIWPAYALTLYVKVSPQCGRARGFGRGG